jgi:hypothetical protein
MTPQPEIGTLHGLCNRTACRAPDATWFNKSTRKHYCEECAHVLNLANFDEARELYGNFLCENAAPSVADVDSAAPEGTQGVAEHDSTPRRKVRSRRRKASEG